ncbi:MAG: hypothetical protein KDE31_08115, partial [Caldilineaceae bacterium]|nr:hypothetical protein [Caldilineaceae bacterium]
MKPTIHFTETMSGQGRLVHSPLSREGLAATGYTPPEDSDFVRAHICSAKKQGEAFAMAWRDLAVAVTTTERSNGGGLAGTIERGVIEVAGLAAEPLLLEKGEFALLPAVAPGRRRMRYQLQCRRADGQKFYTLYGFKQVERATDRWRLLALWQDTTTLFVTIYDDGPGGVARGLPLAARSAVAATGIIRIFPLAFARQLLTFRSTEAGNFFGHVANALRFFRFFS